MSTKLLIVMTVIALICTSQMGLLAKNLHQYFPMLFGKPSAFPFADSFVTVMSIVATYLMIQKKVECWAVWFLVDAIACYLYFAKGIKFVGMEYLIFCFIAAFGLWNWNREARSHRVA